MTNTSGIRAGRAYVEIFADSGPLARGLKQAQVKLREWGKGVREVGMHVMALGTAMGAPLIAGVKAFTTMGDSLAKISQRTGVSVEALSQLGYAAELSGTNLESLEGGIKKMQRLLVQAAQGSKGAMEALNLLGLSIKDLDTLKPDQQFALLADRISQIHDEAIRTAMAMEVFGRGGTALLPLMNKGAAGIAALREEAQRLGLTIRSQDAGAAEQLKDKFETLWAVLKRGSFAIGSALAPALSELVGHLINAGVAAARWISDNRQLVISLAKIVGTVLAVGAGLVALGTAISSVGTVFGAVRTVIHEATGGSDPATAKLYSASSGSARILWKESGETTDVASLKWAIVRLGDEQPVLRYGWLAATAMAGQPMGTS